MPFVRWAAPGGYLISNARDLSHFLIAHLNEGSYAGTNVISAEGMRELHRPAAEMSLSLSYVMGWVAETADQELMLWHNGSTPNFYSYIALLPERRLGVVFLAIAVDLFVADQSTLSRAALIALLRGEEPRIRADASFHPPLGVSLIYVLLAFLLQLGWMGFSAAMRRPRGGQRRMDPLSGGERRGESDYPSYSMPAGCTASWPIFPPRKEHPCPS